MINRALLRTKVVQILYSYYKSEGKSLPTAEKELSTSIEKTYDLYFHLLQLAIDVTRFFENKIETKRNKLRPTHEDLHPNTTFVDNKFIQQLKVNTSLLNHLKDSKLSWTEYPDIVKKLAEEITDFDFYKDYMATANNDYTSDKDIWRKIYKKVFLSSIELDESIEDQNIYWTDDVELVISFIIKTIKKFEEDNGANQALLPMYRDEEDATFAKKLLKNSISNRDLLRELIDANTKNWELERIAFMDNVIMEIALTEIMEFPTIPVSVTLNEYIEIAKNYSTDKSGTFINGILDNIVKKLKSENKLIKVVNFNDEKSK